MSELKVNVWDWVVLKNGKIRQITHDDMLDLKYEDIERLAQKDEIPVKEYELRMYFFVPYNISPIQQGIQAGHSLGRYCLKYGRFNHNHIVWDFLEKWETFIILNGGTTNDQRDFEMIPAGSLNQIVDELQDNSIQYACMIEPDLNRALSAVCFIADERVFNYKDYPNFVDYIVNSITVGATAQRIVTLKMMPEEELKETYKGHYEGWVYMMGGEKNIFLRELIKGKKLA